MEEVSNEPVAWLEGGEPVYEVWRGTVDLTPTYHRFDPNTYVAEQPGEIGLN